MTTDDIAARIKAAIPDAKVTVEDTRGDGQHYTALVESPSFAGLTRIAQHQMVYRALGQSVGNEIHALQLITRSA